MAQLVETSYRIFGAHRLKLVVATIMAVALGLLSLVGTSLDGDVALLLPDGSGEAAKQFKLLRSAPFASTLVINLHSNDASATSLTLDELIASGDRLAAALDPALFSRVIKGPEGDVGERLVEYLLKNLPRLLTQEDMEELARRTEPEMVEQAVERAFATLVAPGGTAMKGVLQRDPLGFLELAGAKLNHLKLLGSGDFKEGRFLSPDNGSGGRSLLLFAETPVMITDAEGADRLEREFARAVGVALPEAGPVRADLIGAHRYSAANARTIKDDLATILTAASVGVLAFFLLWLRGPGALAVWLLPLGGLSIAAALTAWVHGSLSGITLGFGGVLLGISVDYGLHVYYACKGGAVRSGAAAGRALGRVVKPVTFAALTTLAGFAVLFTSHLPGQRQLALFAVCGVALCLLGALFILPHLIGVGSGRPPGGPGLALSAGGAVGKAATALWCVWLITGVWFAAEVSFVGDLKKLGMRPPELLNAEEVLERQWGAVRSRAFAWAEGDGLDLALTRAHEGFVRLQQSEEQGLRRGSGQGRIASAVVLTPLLPPLKVQAENMERWKKFWSASRTETVRKSLEENGVRRGFTPAAFAPFVAALDETPPPVTVQTLRDVGLGEVVDALLVEGRADGKGGSAVLILAPDDGTLDSALVGEVPGVTVVSPKKLSTLLGDSIKEDFIRFITLALTAVVLMTALLLRRPVRVLAALSPVAAGLISLLGVAGLMGWEFDLFNIVASILTIGLGVDYGIFMTLRSEGGEGGEESGDSDNVARAVLVSGVTTLAGVGSLVLATHPSLHSIGVTVLVGVGAAMATALWVTPTLASFGKRGRG
jgi:predicted exporter